MKRFNLHLLTFSCCLPLAFAAACTDDSTGDDDIGDTGTDTDTGDTDSSDTNTDDPDTETDSTDSSESDTAEDTNTDDPSDTTDDTTDDATDTGGVCGDQVIEGNEQCEGTDLAGADCVSLGFSGGDLACADDCTYDTGACTAAVCGDGIVAGSEACDGSDFGGNTCEALGYTGGTLACLDDCTLDESGCFNAACGDEMISGLEECDGALLNDMTCADVGFAGGELACSAECTFDTAGCNSCGNDVIDEGELCDGSDLGGATCADLGYLGGGELSCNATCDALVEDECNEWWGEDFEAGAQLGAEWVLSGSANWFGSNVMPHAGTWNGESGNISDSQQSHMEVTLNFVQAGDVTFWRRVSTEASWDFLRFSIDGAEQVSWSGNLGWAQAGPYNVAAGVHTLRWSYTKDGSLSSNADTVWVDDIVTTGAVLP